MAIRVGNEVKVICKYWHIPGIRKGVVTEIQEYNKNNPVEEHGGITVLLENGEEEHFVHYEWEKSLKIIRGVG